MSSQPHAGQAKVVFCDWFCMTHFVILRDVLTDSGWCLKGLWSSQKYPPLLWCDILSVVGVHCPHHFGMQGFLKHLSLGKFLPPASQLSYASCVAHFWNCLLAFTKKQITLGPCQKSGESQQCCDNPRVKGVNMRREFHAWQVRRMAPVFSLFTHANEQYADEQTWAGLCLLHKAGRKLVGVAPLPPLESLVCCTFWWLFTREAFPWQVRFLPCIISLFTVFFWQQQEQFLFQAVFALKSLWNYIFDSILLPRVADWLLKH